MEFGSAAAIRGDTIGLLASFKLFERRPGCRHSSSRDGILPPCRPLGRALFELMRTHGHTKRLENSIQTVMKSITPRMAVASPWDSWQRQVHDLAAADRIGRAQLPLLAAEAQTVNSLFTFIDKSVASPPSIHRLLGSVEQYLLPVTSPKTHHLDRSVRRPAVRLLPFVTLNGDRPHEPQTVRRREQ